MAKRRKSRKSKKGILSRFFIPSEIRSMKGWFWFMTSRIGFAIANFYLCLTLVFSAVPVPFSAYMVQKKVENLFHSDYRIHYDWVSIDDIAWQMQMAVIAGEDQNFENHFGIDVDAILLALKRNANSRKKPRGASTISQQTVKNLYLWHGTSWVRKGLEVPLTLLVEALWSKQRVLEVYLNIAEFGRGIFGVQAAAKHYFGKSAKQLTLQESALLAASLPNPFIYRVDRPTTTMLKRQRWIMQQIQNLGGRIYLEKL
ncbi:monofunctional biosynthetic peptidoglycan transglycosylase [Vespertiliibacter pulmonis]|uniref:Biosynthetic peptidoglycan transglycosylase n=1 Tax=Vespertiliibacter pulmonis TaxID=1443036 RepID=A0A3N4W422_9PAST|nr:monofunctional biosynthetic peptidoglycan transglycosylase [Vespertiliibacter pulmonis]QLB21505.1 monofunctional biosynthetic peptidoglycan transglycosylase [Vespertiliibacter pulmonis]RPE85921.1 monofunctional biosynthetic peptidoglycan transglycosylase [Vespertiliibacter pulmonis]